MNEVDFVQLSRGFETGTPVLFFSDGERREDNFSAALEGAVGGGIVLRFVDPAKPLLVYRRRDAFSTGVDFFQDVLYAAEPAIQATHFALWEGMDQKPTDLERWVTYLEQVVDRPLRGETPLFDAYRAGAFGRRYNELPEASLPVWMRTHLELLSLGSKDLVRGSENYSVWDGHNAYSFS
jgi:hypothetical protein